MFFLVLGPVPSSELGVVLSHEHLLVDFSHGIVTGPAHRCGRSMRDLELVMENVGIIRKFP